MSNYKSTITFLHPHNSNRDTTQHNKIEKYTSRDGYTDIKIIFKLKTIKQSKYSRW
jgi:hypothetical protein